MRKEVNEKSWVKFSHSLHISFFFFFLISFAVYILFLFALEDNRKNVKCMTALVSFRQNEFHF